MSMKCHHSIVMFIYDLVDDFTHDSYLMLSLIVTDSSIIIIIIHRSFCITTHLVPWLLPDVIIIRHFHGYLSLNHLHGIHLNSHVHW